MSKAVQQSYRRWCAAVALLLVGLLWLVLSFAAQAAEEPAVMGLFLRRPGVLLQVFRGTLVEECLLFHPPCLVREN